MRETISAVLARPLTERAIMALILVNAVTLGMETSKSIMDAWGGVILWLDKAILAVFVAEIAARLYVHRWRFFKDPWSVFDFLVIVIALLPATGSLSVLRALRVLRVLRLITILPSLRRVVAGLITALPGMGSITLLLAIIFYVFAVMATKLFGEDFEKLFGTLGASAFTLFQIMTLEGWANEIVRPVMEKYPAAWLFFIPYIVMTTFMVLNLFIGVVVSAMQKETEAATEKVIKVETDVEAHILAELKALRAEVASLKNPQRA